MRPSDAHADDDALGEASAATCEEGATDLSLLRNELADAADPLAEEPERPSLPRVIVDCDLEFEPGAEEEADDDVTRERGKEDLGTQSNLGA